MVAYSHHFAAAQKAKNERRSCRFDDRKNPSPRRRLKRGQYSRGINRAGVTTKLHLAITPDGHIVEARLTGGNTADISIANELMSDVVGCYVVEDMGYDSDAHRDFLRSQNNVPVIPGRKNRKVKIVYNKDIYKLRGGIERYFGKLKENKRMATRYDKHDTAFLGFLAIAAIKILLTLRLC
jgi:transposase